MKVDITDKKGKTTGDQISLDDSVWCVPMNKDLVSQAIQIYLDNQRKGTAHAKTRGEIRGGGKKPWSQKGTGRARHGSIRSPLWRKGGATFGPRSYKKIKRMPRKMARLALKCVLSEKVSNQKVIFLKEMKLEKLSKTQKVAGFLHSVGVLDDKVLIIVPELNKGTSMFRNGVRNLSKVWMKQVLDVNVYDTLGADKLIVFTKSVKELEKRLS
ncbi:MAG: 50S ribosomal protein L4 [Patescibacteria group bacterium]|nr:50S ribosomal protein L4 [Patescibacteria group bacterium]